jgi:Ca2+-binding RTX toxin-like protein
VDSLAGGAGADTFNFASTETGITLATADTITDYAVVDFFDFAQVAGSAANYFEGAAGGTNDFAAALAAADIALNGTRLYAAISYGADVGLFVDLNGDGTSDQVIILVGGALANISETNII